MDNNKSNLKTIILNILRFIAAFGDAIYIRSCINICINLFLYITFDWYKGWDITHIAWNIALIIIICFYKTKFILPRYLTYAAVTFVSLILEYIFVYSKDILTNPSIGDPLWYWYTAVQPIFLLPGIAVTIFIKASNYKKTHPKNHEKDNITEPAYGSDEESPYKRIIIAGICFIALMAVLVPFVFVPHLKLNEAKKLMNDGQIEQAYAVLEEIDTSKAKSMICESKYSQAEALFQNHKYIQAQELYYEIYEIKKDYADAFEKYQECCYLRAKRYIEKHEYDKANIILAKLGDYKDSKELIHNHDFIVTIEKELSCEEDGQKYYKCKDCNYSFREINEAYGHLMLEATCTSPRKCFMCNKEFGEPLGHIAEDAEEYSSFSDWIDKKKKRTFSEWRNDKYGLKICQRCGETFFETQTYSGYGPGYIHNINLAKGIYKITGTHDGDSKFDSIFYPGEDELGHLIADEIGECRTVYELEVYKNIENGYIVIHNADGYWTITIEKVGQS